MVRPCGTRAHSTELPNTLATICPSGMPGRVVLERLRAQVAAAGPGNRQPRAGSMPSDARNDTTGGPRQRRTP